jgi:hypothetical protein
MKKKILLILTALTSLVIANPVKTDSDFTNEILRDREIRKEADEDALAWYSQHHPDHKIEASDLAELLPIGRGRAFKKGLRGSEAETFAEEFFLAIEAQSAAE